MFFLRFFCAGVFLIFSQGSFAQVTISGCLTDKKDSTDFSQVAVILYHINSDNVLTYTFTDSSGCFVFNQVPEGIFTIKVNYPGYQPFSRDIVVATNDSVRITVPIILEQKTNMLSEIIVKGTRPVIVKKDTVIYDPSYWTQTTDRTLEEVLVRMPGFKISSEGEIFVNNKPVEKVLIDGKEISNAGAAIITRSVDPEDVKKIEVRFDEKDAVLKESLLETRKLVVLDIELKEDIKKSFFGLARASAGYQQAAGAGFYGNFFSLKKKINLHAFAEHDRFGHQTISLDAIKNLGEEAFKKNLQINADFNEEIEKTEFKKEIYGFKDFNLYRNTIAGITFNKQLNTKLKLYGGSYNNHQILGNQERYEQQFIDQNNINFIKTNKYDYFSSKSKAELRFDSQQIKGRFDVNVAITNNRLISTNIGNANYHYNTNTSHTSINLYQNAMLEYLAKNGWALRFKSALAYLNSNERKNMAHNDSTYGWVLYNSSGNTVYNFAQNIFNQQLTWGSSAGVFLNKSKWKSAFQFYTLTQQIRHSKTGWDEALLNHEAPLANFTLPETTRQFFKFSPALSQTLTFNNLKFSGEFFYTTIAYPLVFSGAQNVKTAPEYSVSIDFYSNRSDHIILSFERKFSTFNMQKILAGYMFVDFQNILTVGSATVTPQLEEIGQLWIGINADHINLHIDPTFIVGRSRLTNRINLDGRLPIFSLYDQLPSRYVLVTVPFVKSFKKIPFQFEIVPEVFNTYQTNIDLNEIPYTTKALRSMLGFKIYSMFQDKRFNFTLYPKFSRFLFSSEGKSLPSVQYMNSYSALFNWKLHERLVLASETRGVVFKGASTGHFLNTSIQVRYAAKNALLWFEADNLLNNKSFLTQTIQPNFLINNWEGVFGRYVKIGIDVKFK